MSWLNELKPGDTVLIRNSGLDNRLHRATIERATKTQLVINGVKWRRSTGFLVSNLDRWARSRLVRPTDSAMAECIKDELCAKFEQKCRQASMYDYDQNTMRAVIEAFENGSRTKKK